MFERLIRLCLAFAVAFVFAGQMEAAAAHCVRLAQAEAIASADELPAPPEAIACHGESQEMAQPRTGHHSQPEQPHHDQAKHHKSGERCECVGVLTACATVVGAAGSSHIEPYAWARPEAAAFASTEPAPALRPPRA